MNTGDNAFILICSALVFFMTPALAFFYGGMVRRKNVLNTIMACVGVMGLSVVMWVMCGYSFAFGPDHLGLIGGLKYFFLNGIDFNSTSPYAPTLSATTFVIFQMMFAMITPALITGSVVGRMRFPALMLFIALWSLIVYYPLAHMVWGAGGMIAKWGAVDFAGGNVVHISSGVSGLILAAFLGKRRGVEHVSYRVHNIPFVFLGAGILWFGWFGFNAGSALAANGLAAHAFLTTTLSAAAALLSWMAIDVLKEGKPTLVGASTGLVVGLVAITPGAGFVPLWAAFIIGILVSPICYGCMHIIKTRLKIDDALDAFGCHGIGGIWGGIATGLFAKSSINSVAKWDGLVFGDTHLFVAQLEAIATTIAIAAVGTLICVGITRLVTTMRASAQDEAFGMDNSQHGEDAYPAFNGFDSVI